jgi:hypothetical protein
MKNTFIILVALSLSLLISCEDRGVTSERLSGNENELPEELKGLKIYNVSLGNGSYVKVAVMNNQPVATTYPEGKHTESVVMIHKNQNRVIDVESIISENDSILVIKKLR